MAGRNWIDAVSRLLVTSPELSPILLGVLQITGFALGILALKRWHGQDKSWLYVVCLGGVIAVIMVLPLRLARWEWSCSFSFIEHRSWIAESQPIATLTDSASQFTSNPFRHFEAIPKGHLEFSPDDSLVASSTVQPSVAVRPLIPWSTMQIAIAVYSIVVLFQLITTARGWQLLRRAARRGSSLGEPSSRLVEDCRQRLKISTQVMVLRSNEVSMPLTFGVMHPVVLLPVDFEEWTALEQRAVAMHEFSHIARRDILGELLVRSMQALYWLHPASHWIAKQVRAAREGATDQHVIATGFSPQKYARCLVQILEREHTRSTKGLTCIPSVAMSAYGDMEVRINSILRGEEKMDYARKSIWIVCLVLFMSFTMVRLEAVPWLAPEYVSDESSTMPMESNESEESSKQGQSSTLLSDDSKGSQRNDLLDLILNTPVVGNISAPDGVEISLAGRVLGPNQEPVRGCTVVLSHLDMRQLATKGRLEASLQDSGNIRLQSLLARTITDEDGRYTFANVVAPSDLRLAGSEKKWTGQLIAGHSELGIGWEGFETLREHLINREHNIHLSEMTSVEGQCLNSDGTPAKESNVMISSLHKKADGRSGLFLCGALHVNSLTDSNGRIRFFHLPGDTLAGISASGSGGITFTVLHIKTDQGSNLSDFGRIALPPGVQIQTSPALLNLRKPIQIPVRVINTNGKPISGAKLFGDGPYQTTDHQGIALWTLNPQIAEAKIANTAANQVARIVAIFDSGSPYLRTEITVRWDSITEAKTIEIIAEKGTRVRGKVFTNEGSVASGVLIYDPKSIGQSGRVDKEGNFEITVPKKKCRLLVCRSEGGYRIPSVKQVQSVNGSTFEIPDDWKYIDVDATSGDDIELPTITVQRAEPIHLFAQLPNGLPAINATAILTDIDIRKVERNTSFSKGFLSTNTSTDNNGLATIVAQGVPSKLASVEVRLLYENVPYLGIASLDQISAGKLLVRLKPEWLIRGRISLDGQPVQGAWVHAIRHVSTNGEILRPDSVLHCHMTTNDLGEYEFIMPRDRDYEIQVSGLPQDSSCHGSTHKLTRRSASEMEVPEFRYERGTESIAGSVVDVKGEPIAGAFVFIQGNRERLWIGQSRSSPVKSDKSGRFVMPNLPRGPFRLKAQWGEGPSTTASSSEVITKSGETDVRLIVPAIQTPK